MARTCLIDANILVYTLDITEPDRIQCSLAFLDEITTIGIGALSTQIMGEFYNTITRKLRKLLLPEDALKQVSAYAGIMPVYDITLPIVLEAARGAVEHQMSYWDAQVWATAKLNQIPYVLTEDLPGKDYLEGVRYLNPLAPDFSLDLLLPGK